MCIRDRNGSVHVQIGHFFPAGDVHVVEVLVGSQSCARHISTGNVEQNVDTSPLGNDVIGKFLKTGDVQYVTDDTDYICTIGFQFLDTLVQLFLTDCLLYTSPQVSSQRSCSPKL